MFTLLLQSQWKSFFRSASLGKSLALKIFMGFLAVYFGLSFLILGIGLYPLLKEQFPAMQPLTIVHNFTLVWLFAELITRYLLQSLPVMNIKPLLVINIKKTKIVHFILVKSLFSFYNFLAPLAIIPFGLWCVVKGDLSFLQLLAWWITMISMMLSINYLNFLINKKFAENTKALLPFIAVVGALVALEYFQIFSVSEWFGGIMAFLVAYPILFVIPLAIAGGLYYWNYRYLYNNCYLDGAFQNKKSDVTTADLSWTKRFGDIAPFLQLDLRLIGRNKRPKATIYMSVFFAAYGLIFFTMYDSQAIFLPFLGIFMTGIFVINFGQFIPAWDSSYYSMMMTQNIPMQQYLRSKAGLMYVSIIMMSLLTSPYVYFGVNVLLVNLACAVYNAGINVPIILYAGSFNKKRIDLDKSQFMNYQGTGMAQWLVGIPLLMVPIGLWMLCYFIFNEVIATAALAMMGAIGLLLKNYFMKGIVAAYRKRKYGMVAGFKHIS